MNTVTKSIKMMKNYGKGLYNGTMVSAQIMYKKSTKQHENK